MEHGDLLSHYLANSSSQLVSSRGLIWSSTALNFLLLLRSHNAFNVILSGSRLSPWLHDFTNSSFLDGNSTVYDFPISPVQQCMLRSTSFFC